MPLYEYECSSCSKIHEIMQKFSDPAVTSCPECQGPVRKLLSLSSFSLKGSGWYTTDYKRAGSSAKASEAAAPAASTATATAPAAPSAASGSASKSST